MPFNLLQPPIFSNGETLITKKRKQLSENSEPRSVLEACPSPPTSSSTLSSSLTGGPAAADAPWASLAADDWDTILSIPPPSQEQTFFQWIMDDSGKPQPVPGFDIADTSFGYDPIVALGNGFPQDIGFTYDTIAVNQQEGYLNHNPAYHLQHLQYKPEVAAAGGGGGGHQQQAMVDQLYKAAELIEAGNPVSARGILARLNQQLPSPAGKPLLRSAFYFKEVLSLIATGSPSRNLRVPSSPLDVVLKLGTYNAFSEVSPVLQFTNFTCIQALLEELDGSDRIHIIDFDIGVGGQWSSFIEELAQRRGLGSTGPMLKITAFVSANSHHPLELHLTRENLTHFAGDLNIPFEFNVLSLDPFDPAMLMGLCSIDEAVAVNLPVNCTYHLPPQTMLRLLKQLSPKIVVSVDNGCDRSDLPFSHQFLHAFQSCTVLLDSIDAAGTSPDVSNKIERFLIQPRIENALLGRPAGDKMLPLRTMFTSAGFVPVQFSNFTETQAECLLKRVQVRGFHVEKRNSALFLCWQRGELVSVSAWRC